MEFDIKNTTNASSDGIKVLIYANSGTGKTTQLGTIEGKTLILSAESGLLVLKDKNIDVIDIPDIATLGRVYVALRDKVLDYDTVCIDSLSEIGDMIVSDLDADEYFGDPKNTFPMWKEYSKKIITIVKMFRDLKGINVVFTALRESVEANGSVTYMPQIPAKKAQMKLLSMFDNVIYMNTDNDGKRAFHNNETATFVAKSRIDIPARMIVSDEVNLGSIIKHISHGANIIDNSLS